ncbi:alpha/beta hydrolase [Micromonospora sp. NPDC050417]|uniref:alpha/beta hydrolase n=1 Tax=Micromonospora sp. NPDC050417 TaxID=3364280 RepID=UPI0037ACB099
MPSVLLVPGRGLPTTHHWHDPHATFAQVATYAAAWGAELVDAGDAGHLNTAAGYGPWLAGERLLADLLG